MISEKTIRMLLEMSVILVGASLLNMGLQKFIRLPKKLDNRRTRTYITVIHNGISISIYGFAAYLSFIILGINVTPILASAGIAGLIIGLSSKSLIEDFIAGLFLITEDTIRIGDRVEIDGIKGTLESIRLRTIRIRSISGAITIIPNGQVKKVTNLSRGKRRVIIDITVKNSTPIDKVIAALADALKQFKKDPDIGQDNTSRIQGVEQIKETTTIVRVLLSTTLPPEVPIGYRFRYLVKKEFEKKKIS